MVGNNYSGAENNNRVHWRVWRKHGRNAGPHDGVVHGLHDSADNFDAAVWPTCATSAVGNCHAFGGMDDALGWIQ